MSEALKPGVYPAILRSSDSFRSSTDSGLQCNIVKIEAELANGIRLHEWLATLPSGDRSYPRYAAVLLEPLPFDSAGVYGSALEVFKLLLRGEVPGGALDKDIGVLAKVRINLQHRRQLNSGQWVATEKPNPTVIEYLPADEETEEW